MLLRDEADDVIAIGQASHAWLSGQLARAWGNVRFGAVAPQEEVVLAAEQHDVGMAEWDREPTLDPDTGLPHSFLRMPVETHLALWAAAPERLLTQSTYAALLVSLHGTFLYERRDLEALTAAQAEGVHAYLAGQRALQHRLAQDLDADADLLARNRRLIWTWDALSLALCLRWDPFAVADVPTAGDAIGLTLRSGTLEPWPFAHPELTVACEGRRLSDRSSDEAELREALAAAPLETVRFTLRPA